MIKPCCLHFLEHRVKIIYDNYIETPTLSRARFQKENACNRNVNKLSHPIFASQTICITATVSARNRRRQPARSSLQRIDKVLQYSKPAYKTIEDGQRICGHC